MNAPQSVLEVVDRFDPHRDTHLLPAYNEAQVRRVIERRIASTDDEIGQLVYELYALTKDEIAIVEGATVQ